MTHSAQGELHGFRHPSRRLQRGNGRGRMTVRRKLLTLPFPASPTSVHRHVSIQSHKTHALLATNPRN